MAVASALESEALPPVAGTGRARVERAETGGGLGPDSPEAGLRGDAGVRIGRE